MSYSNSYTRVTVHTKKVSGKECKAKELFKRGLDVYQGYVKVEMGATIDGKDVKNFYKVFCPTFRLTREDAIKDAINEKESML